MSGPGVERLAGVLHEMGCGCGTPSDLSRAEAQALMPVVEQMIAEAEVEALRSAARDWQVAWYWPLGATTWLRRRAYKITRGVTE